MPKINSGGDAQTAKRLRIPPAPPFNKQAHDREHFPTSIATGSFNGWFILGDGTPIGVENTADLHTNTHFPNWLQPSDTDVGGYYYSGSANNPLLQIPVGLGGIYDMSWAFQIKNDDAAKNLEVGMLLYTATSDFTGLADFTTATGLNNVGYQVQFILPHPQNVDYNTHQFRWLVYLAEEMYFAPGLFITGPAGVGHPKNMAGFETIGRLIPDTDTLINFRT